MQLLQKKKALVTGGTAGIGKEIAIVYAQNGADVCIFGTNAERGQQVVEELYQNKVRDDQNFYFEAVNVADKPSVDAAIGRLLERWGQVDILVNNAGITRDGLLMKMSEEDWDAVIDVNLKSVYNVSQALVRSMIKAKTGKIINISSVVGLTGNAGQVNYAASKSGIIGLTKALAQEVAKRGICVNGIAPGFIATKMTDVLNEKVKEDILRKIPMEKLGTARDVAHAALFLASSMSDYMTGQTLTVDGGMVM